MWLFEGRREPLQVVCDQDMICVGIQGIVPRGRRGDEHNRMEAGVNRRAVLKNGTKLAEIVGPCQTPFLPYVLILLPRREVLEDAMCQCRRKFFRGHQHAGFCLPLHVHLRVERSVGQNVSPLPVLTVLGCAVEMVLHNTRDMPVAEAVKPLLPLEGGFLIAWGWEHLERVGNRRVHSQYSVRNALVAAPQNIAFKEASKLFIGLPSARPPIARVPHVRARLLVRDPPEMLPRVHPGCAAACVEVDPVAEELQEIVRAGPPKPERVQSPRRALKLDLGVDPCHGFPIFWQESLHAQSGSPLP